MPNKNVDDIISKLSDEIASDAGNNKEDDLDSISQSFDQSLTNALKSFNSASFDNEGFIKKMSGLNLGDKKDSETIKNVLNNIRSEYINVDAMNQSELLLRRDLFNICTQMPEMHDVISVVRDAIIECNVSTGEVSRSVTFQNHENEADLETQVKELELKHKLLMAIKNFIVPKTLMHGEMYIYVVPFAKLFAELEVIHDARYNTGKKNKSTSAFGESFKQSIPEALSNSFVESVSMYSEDNVTTLVEATASISSIDTINDQNIDQGNSVTKESATSVKKAAHDTISDILHNIDVYNGSSIMMSEYGFDGFKHVLMKEYKEAFTKKTPTRDSHFMESQANYAKANQGMFANVDQDTIDFKSYSDIKGCYVKYLDGLRMVPVRMDRRVIGYYYVSTTRDLQTNSANPNGIVDLSYQNYTRDRNMVDKLAGMIIKSFSKPMLEKNVQLKGEIAEIIMAHKFSEGKLSFIYIPENEVVRLVINEDEDGKGHSILEPTIFPARMYLMLNLYNMLYTLNNNTTRVHYLKSSGLNKDYASQIQRTIRKFQQRRITIDDIYSYSGVLNKIGGMGEMVLPAGRNDYKAMETDTIEATNNPINTEFLEQQRRQAITGTGVPNLLVVNSLDEVDFAKTLEMANTRFLSTVSSYKIDFNGGITKFYQALLKSSTDIPDETINSFRFTFNAVKQPELVITADMIQNFNTLVETVMSIYYSKGELETKDGAPTPKAILLKKKLAEEYLPQLDFDKLEEIVKQVDIESAEEELRDKANNATITNQDIDEVDET